MKQYSILFALLTLLLFAACNDEEYHYPSVKLEFLTAHADATGKVESVLTDEGITYPVAEDGSGLELAADTTLRIVCNYEPLQAQEAVRLYAALPTVSPLPKPASQFKEGIHTDPAELLSGWMGLDYLNLILTVKAQKGKHTFHFIEEEVTADAAAAVKTVRLLLYHDAGDDTTGYTQRAYLSVPLQQYAEPGMSLQVQFSLHTEGGAVKRFTYQ